MRLFFDVLNGKSRRYDFHGRDFGKPEDATQVAQLIAADLGFSETEDWVGSQVQVKDSAGQTLFSVSVRIAA